MTECEARIAVAKAIQKARETAPLTPAITNTVTVNFVANAQLAVGGSAAMVYLPDEGEMMASLGGAVYINMGTLFPIYAETLPRTAEALKENGTPWVLDPVGIGIGSLRSQLLRSFAPFPPTIVRGNASEVIALAKLWKLVSESEGTGVRGVDATDAVKDAKKAAVAMAKFIGGAVAVSGEEDFVTDGKHGVTLSGGSPLMTKITGAGCSLGGVVAVYAAVATPFIAVLTGSMMYNAAGNVAAGSAKAPASFQIAFLDALYQAKGEAVSQQSWEWEDA